MNPIYIGNDIDYTLSFKKVDNSPINITDWKVYFTMKKDLSLSDSDITGLKEDVTIHDDPTNGITSIHLSADQTAGLEPVMYFYDIQIKRADLTFLTVVSGQIEVRAKVTRRRD